MQPLKSLPDTLRCSPLFGAAVGMVLGIVAGDVLDGSISWLLPLGLCLGCICTLLPKRISVGMVHGIWALFGLFLGMLLVPLNNPLSSPFLGSQQAERQFAQFEGTARFDAVVQGTPKLTPKRLKVTVQVTSVNNISARHGYGKALLYLHQEDTLLQLQKGDQLQVAGNATAIPGPEMFGGFDYRQYAARQHIYRQIFANHSQLTARHQPNRLERLHLRWKQRVQNSTLSPSQQGIVEALLLGSKEHLNPQIREQYCDAGIMHLLCVSGLHVGIIAYLAGACLFFVGKRTWQKALKGLIQLAVVWGFVAFTGGAPSSMRAGIMFSFLIVGKVLSQNRQTLNALAASALIQMMANPMAVFDIGFQLSHLAVLGIIILEPRLYRLIPFPDNELTYKWPWYRQATLFCGAKLWGWVCVSLAAQLATMPLVLYHFHQFPTYFLIANVVVVPLAGVLLGSALLMMLCHGGLQLLMMRFVGWQLLGIDHLTRWVSNLPHAMVDLPYFNAMRAVLLGLLLVCLAWWLDNFLIIILRDDKKNVFL